MANFQVGQFPYVILSCTFFLIEGNHTIALIKGPEDYNTLKDGLKNVCQAVNEIMEEGQITIDGRRVNLEFYLGGDYKVSAMGIT